MRDRKGHLFVISAPSGAGKSTLCQAALSHFDRLRYSISHTTRPPRPGEQDGVDYHFIPEARFKEMIATDAWVEWAVVHGNHYGTARTSLTGPLAAGEDLLLDIDVQGAAQIVDAFPDAVTIFIMPPTLEVLRQRMESRGQDAPEVIARRMENARAEVACRNRYRHLIINDRLEDARAELIGIIRRYREGRQKRS